MERARIILGHDCFYYDRGLAEMRSEDGPLFISNFFRMFEDSFGEIKDWSTLASHINKQPCVIFLDDLGEIEAPGLKLLIPRLYNLIQTVSNNIRVIATLADVSTQLSTSGNQNYLAQFFNTRGLQNQKYARNWQKIIVSPFDENQALELTNFLPESVRRIVKKNWQNIVSFTNINWQGKTRIAPRKLQCLCYLLFDAYHNNTSFADLEQIVNNKASYE